MAPNVVSRRELSLGEIHAEVGTGSVTSSGTLGSRARLHAGHDAESETGIEVPEDRHPEQAAVEAERQRVAALRLDQRLDHLALVVVDHDVLVSPVEDALAHLRANLRPVVGIEQQPLEAAEGRILAQDLTARRANPPQANSAVDGYGFAGPLPEGVARLPLVEGRAAAGVPFAGAVPPGHALRILTGAALPEGVDSVALQEDVTTDGRQIALNGPLKRGANARRAGEDVAEGATVLRAGRRLTPADLALLAAVGHGTLPLRRRLRR